MSDGVLMQEATTVTTGTDAATETPPPVCRCGADPHPTHAGICEKGHALHGNQLRFVHGAYRVEARGDSGIPANLRQTADDMLAGILADKGGAENLTTLKREYAQQARTLRVMLDLIGNYLVRNGITTQRGRVRSAVSKYLEVFDRFDKAAQRIGLERDTRQVPSLSDYLAQAQPPSHEEEKN